MAIRLLARQNLMKLAASFTLLNPSQKILVSPSHLALGPDAFSASKCFSPFYPFVNSPSVRWASYESVNLVLSDDGKPKFEIEEVEPSKKGRFLTKRRLKLQRKREKRKRKEANKNDPRRIRPKGKKNKTEISYT